MRLTPPLRMVTRGKKVSVIDLDPKAVSPLSPTTALQNLAELGAGLG